MSLHIGGEALVCRAQRSLKIFVRHLLGDASPSPSPEASASPSPTPEPCPSPSPTPTPEPSPSPSPTPNGGIPEGTDCCFGYYCLIDAGAGFLLSCLVKTGPVPPCNAGGDDCAYTKDGVVCLGDGNQDDTCPNIGDPDPLPITHYCYVLTSDTCVS